MQNQRYEQDIGETGELGDLGRVRRGPAGMDARAGMRVRRMPYDYVAKFTLSGQFGRRVSAVINVSAEAWFICTSIGYSLEEPLSQTPPQQPGPIFRSNGAASLAHTRFDPRLNLISLAKTIDPTNPSTAIQDSVGVEQLNALQIQNIRDSLSFKYAIIDKGSGRELQNEPVHNIAGLGKPDGVRPFRELVVPYIFAPNSSILIEIEELLTLANGTIHMDFQGYKEFR